MKEESGYWQNFVLCDGSILYSPFYLSQHWLLTEQFCKEMLCCQSYYFQLKKWYSGFLKSVCIFQKIYFKVKILKLFKMSSDCHVKASWSLKWRAILKIPNLKEPMLFLLALKWNLYEKVFPVLRQKPIFAINLAEMLKEATIHFFLIDESHFSNICTL